MLLCEADTNEDGKITTDEFSTMAKKWKSGDNSGTVACLPASCDPGKFTAMSKKVKDGKLPISADGDFFAECAGGSSLAINMLMVVSLATLMIMISH